MNIYSVPSEIYSLQRTCHKLRFFALIFILLLMAACSGRYHDMPAYIPFKIKEYKNYGPGRFKCEYIVRQIDEHYRGANPGPIGVTTFVNADDLYQSSTFGRLYAEQVMSELAMRGYDVVELRHSDALQFLATNGEFALSRDISVVRRERELGAVVVGTYVVSPKRVYVNARLIDPSTSIVLSAGSVEMSKTKELARLLRGGSLPTTLERIPVRHLGLQTYPMYGFPGYQGRLWDLEESGALAGGGSISSNMRPNFSHGRTKVDPKVKR
ncbi:MAG: hypothetical protein D6719_08540 [Candidatus Dadabacteria bacterium]|nr:MAG: hypothetical protein D6719_08540 [Candidatus Dadabacteria bacterium]